MTILPIKHKIEHKSIKAQTQKKKKIGHMKKTQKSVQPCSIMYNENTISEVFN